jgi:hypothetical protein
MQQTKLSIAALAAAAGSEAAVARTEPVDVAERTEESPPAAAAEVTAAAAQPEKATGQVEAQAAGGREGEPEEVPLHERFIQKAIANGGDERVLRDDFPDDIGSKRGDAIPAKTVAILVR